MKPARAKRKDVGRSRVTERKSNCMSVACTDTEESQIRALAKDLGMTPSAFLRMSIKHEVERRLFGALVQLGATSTEAEQGIRKDKA